VGSPQEFSVLKRCLLIKNCMVVEMVDMHSHIRHMHSLNLKIKISPRNFDTLTVLVSLSWCVNVSSRGGRHRNELVLIFFGRAVDCSRLNKVGSNSDNFSDMVRILVDHALRSILLKKYFRKVTLGDLDNDSTECLHNTGIYAYITYCTFRLMPLLQSNVKY